MSEQNNSHHQSEDPVYTALELEREISNKLQESGDRARKEVRSDMERWLEIMDSPKTRKQYEEELGEVNPEQTKAELLNAIRNTYPQVAKQLGWDPKMEQVQEEQYGQAA